MKDMEAWQFILAIILAVSGGTWGIYSYINNQVKQCHDNLKLHISESELRTNAKIKGNKDNIDRIRTRQNQLSKYLDRVASRQSSQSRYINGLVRFAFDSEADIGDLFGITKAVRKPKRITNITEFKRSLGIDIDDNGDDDNTEDIIWEKNLYDIDTINKDPS